MRVGILGTGDVGRALGAGFVACGHEVLIGSRDPEKKKVTEWVATQGSGASSGTFEEAARFGEVIVLATLWSGTENALRLAGHANFAGKVVIDVTNPLDFSGGMPPPRLTHGHTDSGGEQVQRWLPAARAVRCFNIVGNPGMFRPQYPGGPPDMFYCGNDTGAKETVAKILTEFGWSSAFDIGGMEGARILEPFCLLWVAYGMRTNTWNHALTFLRK